MSQEAFKALKSYSSELDLTNAEGRLMMLYAWKADEHGVLIASHKRIAEEWAWTERGVQAALAGLKRKDVIHVVANGRGGAPGTAPWIRLNLPGLSGNVTATVRRVIETSGKLPAEIQRRLGRAHDERGTPSVERGTHSAPVGVRRGVETGTQSVPYQLVEQLERETREELVLEQDSLDLPLTSNTTSDVAGSPEPRDNGRRGREEGEAEPPAVPAAVVVVEERAAPASLAAKRAGDQAWLESAEGRAYLAKLERRRVA